MAACEVWSAGYERFHRWLEDNRLVPDAVYLPLSDWLDWNVDALPDRVYGFVYRRVCRLVPENWWDWPSDIERGDELRFGDDPDKTFVVHRVHRYWATPEFCTLYGRWHPDLKR